MEYAPPELVFRVTVSAGTYVRALARDLGERLGVGAHLTALRREVDRRAPGRGRGAARREVDADGGPAGPGGAGAPAGASSSTSPARAAVQPRPGGPGRCRCAGATSPLMHEGELVAVAHAGDGWFRPSVVLGTP